MPIDMEFGAYGRHGRPHTSASGTYLLGAWVGCRQLTIFCFKKVVARVALLPHARVRQRVVRVPPHCCFFVLIPIQRWAPRVSFQQRIENGVLGVIVYRRIEGRTHVLLQEDG